MVLGVNALGTWDAAMADFNGKTVLGSLWLAANPQSPAGGLRWPIFSFLKYFWKDKPGKHDGDPREMARWVP
jgi:hypothetical protein